MKNIAIIGAGELGSRHLQGILTISKSVFEIFIIDPSTFSLEISKQRASELKHNHNLSFHSTINNIPKLLDFVIVATSSKVRLKVIEQLLKKVSVNYLLLEKVLFPELKQYDLALDLIKINKVKCWVNHPRRMNENYQSIKKYFESNKLCFFQLVGGSWDMGCNGLHFIDLFEYLSSSSLTSINTEFLNKNVIKSKRDGYIEFTGTITGTLDNKHIFSITSTNGNELIAPSISIMSDTIRFFVQESVSPKIYILDKENSFMSEPVDFNMKYQSQLTGILIEQLIDTGTCDLPSFEHAAKTHKKFIKSFLDRWNLNEGTDYSALPIT